MSIGARSRVKPPTNFTATPNSGINTRIDLAWSAVTSAFHVSAYLLERSLDGNTWTSLTLAQPTSTSKADTGLTLDTVYQYRLRTQDSQGHYSAYVRVSATTPVLPGRRKPTSSHMVAINGNMRTNGALPAGCFAPGISAVLTRSYLGNLDNGDGTYNFTRVDADLAQCATAGVLLYVMIETRSFDGTATNPPTNPNPADLLSMSDQFTNALGATGIQSWVWSPTIQDRISKLTAQFGARYNNNTAFGGVCTQETATADSPGGSATVYTVAGFTGKDQYSADGWQAAMLNMDTDIVSANSKSKHLWFMNFLSGVPVATARQMLGAVARQVVANGGIVAGPDLVTDLAVGGIPTRCYPVYYDVAHAQGTSANGTVGISTTGATACSIQNGEWNGTGAGDPNASMWDLYNQGTSTYTYRGVQYPGARDHTTDSLLNLKYFIWDYHKNPASGGSLSWSDILSIFVDHPTTPDFNA